jgi:putative holliday junction resolvase
VRPEARGRRALGLDLGERRIGVAISDSAGLLALPLCTIERTGDRGSDHAEVLRLVGEHGVGVVVVGLPMSLDGRIGPAARAVQSESETLSGELGPSGVDVVTHDERFTTIEADRALKATGKKGKARRRTVDQSAAAVLLQAWLETGARG